MMCRVLQVNRRYCYHYLKQGGRMPSETEQALGQRLVALFYAHRELYGSRRLAEALQAEGFAVGRCRIRRLMKKHTLQVRYPKRPKTTTQSRHAYPVAENTLNRQFTVTQPNQAWTTDITYLWTDEGWLYLAVVLDLYPRRLAGWPLKSPMRTPLCLDALDMAWWNRKRPANVLHHPDRGSQYAGEGYQARLAGHGMGVSMGRKGDCWDNPPTGRASRTLKPEWLGRFGFPSHEAAKQAVWEYITYYNAERSHSTLGYLSPMGYEQQTMDQKVM
jgi:putative transposase